MSERKVLNKYYPPDFDPLKIPRLRLPKDRQYTVRLMAPCNMRCKTCGEYIYKGKKFNARKETVTNEEYLSIKVFRFYIKCPRCLAEITFKTDPKNADYVVEHGATRNFQALKLAEEAAEKEAKEAEEEEKSNPMKLLEKRTKASKQEMDLLEALEELKDLNQRQARVDYDSMISKYDQMAKDDKKRLEDEEDRFIRSCFGRDDAEGPVIKRLADAGSDEDRNPKTLKTDHKRNPTLLLSEDKMGKPKSSSLLGLVRTKNSSAVDLVKAQNSSASLVKVDNTSTSKPGSSVQPSPANSLSLLSAYSDSESDSD